MSGIVHKCGLKATILEQMFFLYISLLFLNNLELITLANFWHNS